MKVGRFRPAPVSGAVSSGALIAAVVWPLRRIRRAGAGDEGRLGPEHRAAAGVFVVGQRQGVVQALMADAALGVDRHHLALAHLAGLDAHVEDQAVEIGIDRAVAAHRLVLARLFELEIFGAAERAAG